MELGNNVSTLNSTMKSIKLLDGFADPVQDISISQLTNVSVHLSWSPPVVRNGNISGYSIYVDDVSVSYGIYVA